MDPKWLGWVRKLQAIAQSGLTYCKDPYDIERYCILRKIAAEMMASYTDEEPEHVLNLFEQEIGYATPKVDVRGAVFQDNKILLVRERSEGRWTLPGGWVDIGDSPSEAVEREIVEESGYVAHAVKLAAVYDRNKHPHPPLAYHVYKLFFICELLDGNPAVNLEIDEIGFFAEDNLPELSLGRITVGQIARVFEHYRAPSLPTDFD